MVIYGDDDVCIYCIYTCMENETKNTSKTFFDGFTFFCPRHFVTIKSAAATLSARTIDSSKGEVGPRERKAGTASGFFEAGVGRCRHGGLWREKVTCLH